MPNINIQVKKVLNDKINKLSKEVRMGKNDFVALLLEKSVKHKKIIREWFKELNEDGEENV